MTKYTIITTCEKNSRSLSDAIYLAVGNLIFKIQQKINVGWELVGNFTTSEEKNGDYYSVTLTQAMIKKSNID